MPKQILISRSELAKCLGDVSLSTLDRTAKSQNWPKVKIGRRTLFSVSILEQFCPRQHISSIFSDKEASHPNIIQFPSSISGEKNE
ncbi:hypothetical protein [Treponema primitia]|uniref:hypothetical protein n=1 Tax=Treponema primitia TaxID=88058 RepID=UPI0012FD5CFD|nr:hypothetical protein [Treponema primitia]